MQYFNEVTNVLAEALQLGEKVKSLEPSTRLFGSIPELDSMSILTVILALEENFGFVVEDDDIDADTFETVESLVNFVTEKLADG